MTYVTVTVHFLAVATANSSSVSVPAAGDDVIDSVRADVIVGRLSIRATIASWLRDACGIEILAPDQPSMSGSSRIDASARHEANRLDTDDTLAIRMRSIAMRLVQPLNMYCTSVHRSRCMSGIRCNE